MSTLSARCYCESELSFADCCGRFINGESYPQTAEQLMRSRFTAYCLQDATYLKSTWCESKCPATLQFDSNLRWIGLTIKCTEGGDEHDNFGMVEFVAKYKINGRAYRLHEKSNFVKKSSRWVYVGGETS